MNETIIQELTKELNIKNTQINAVLNLLSEGATIPFIARYRKEVTGDLNEDEIRTIEESYRYQENLLKKKEDEKQKNTVLWVLAIIGAVAAVAGIAFAVYRFFAPDYLEDFEEDFDDDFDDYFEDEEE